MKNLTNRHRTQTLKKQNNGIDPSNKRSNKTKTSKRITNWKYIIRTIRQHKVQTSYIRKLSILVLSWIIVIHIYEKQFSFLSNYDADGNHNLTSKRTYRSMNSTFNLFENDGGSSSFVSGFGFSSSLFHFYNPLSLPQQSSKSKSQTRVKLYQDDEKNDSRSHGWGVVDKLNLSKEPTPLSTVTMYKSDDNKFYGPYASIRAGLDYKYHSNFKKSRQLLQDKIIHDILALDPSSTHSDCTKTSDDTPWIVFTAGVMGAGKTHTIRSLHENQYFPLRDFVVVDPDDIRSQFPEYKLYIKTHPELAGECTRKEAGYISEIAIHAALQQRRNVLVDGSLRDSHWYHTYFSYLKKKYYPVKIAILHITASMEHIWERVKKRSEETGRVVPKETIVHALENVPRSIDILTPLSDFFCEINNDDDIHVVQPVGMTWDSFRRNWDSSCSGNLIAL